MDTFLKEELREEIKKSEIYAKTKETLEELIKPGEQFLTCQIEEEKESVVFCYEISGMKSFEDLRYEKRIDRLRALLEIRKLVDEFKYYRFSLNPENLYYDRNFRIYVKSRDLYEPGVSGTLDEMTEQYRALAAHILQKKYDFEDYYLGGEDLYKKNTYLKDLLLMEDCESIETWLEASYETEKEAIFTKRVEVNKGWYQMNVWYMAITLTLIAAAAIFIIYGAWVLLPRKNAMIQAQSSFLDGKYVQVIDDLADLDMKYLDKHLKYILAVSYIKGENLTPEQKENVLEAITVDGEEKLKDYWIYLGRLNTAEAQNIAMQRSDDELLLYAYMTEKAVLEKNTDISGEEKASQLDQLQKKIDTLAKKYETEEETEVSIFAETEE